MPTPKLPAIHQRMKAAAAFCQLKVNNAPIAAMWNRVTIVMVFQLILSAFGFVNSTTFCIRVFLPRVSFGASKVRHVNSLTVPERGKCNSFVRVPRHRYADNPDLSFGKERIFPQRHKDAKEENSTSRLRGFAALRLCGNSSSRDLRLKIPPKRRPDRVRGKDPKNVRTVISCRGAESGFRKERKNFPQRRKVAEEESSSRLCDFAGTLPLAVCG